MRSLARVISGSVIPMTLAGIFLVHVSANRLAGATAATPRPQAEREGNGAPADRTEFAVVGRTAPKLTIEQWVRGQPVALEDARGKVVLLDFFQIICPGCRAAHPYIVEMQRRYSNRGFQVLGIAVAFELFSHQSPDHIRRYVDREAFPYPVAIDRGLIESFRRYRARGTPFAAVIDRKGRLRYLDFFRPGLVEALIQELLDEKASG